MTKDQGSGAGVPQRPLPAWARLEDGKPYIVIAELYEAFKTWCDRNGEDVITAQRFGKRLRQLIPDYEARLAWRVVGGRSVRVLVNMKIVGYNQF